MMMTAWSSNFLLWSKGSRESLGRRQEAEAGAAPEAQEALPRGGEEQDAQEQEAHLPGAALISVA